MDVLITGVRDDAPGRRAHRHGPGERVFEWREPGERANELCGGDGDGGEYLTYAYLLMDE